MKKIILLAALCVFGFGGKFEEASKLLMVSGLYSDASKLFEESCVKDKNAAGCYMAAYSIDVSGDEDANLSKANELYKLACEAGDASGCGIVATMYAGQRDGEKVDSDKEIFFHGRACDGGVASSCLALGQKFDNGEGVAKDYAKAASYYKKACERRDATACFNLGDMSETGEGIAKDLKAASEYYGLSCDYGDDSGCAKFRELNKK